MQNLVVNNALVVTEGPLPPIPFLYPNCQPFLTKLPEIPLSSAHRQQLITTPRPESPVALLGAM